MASVNAGLGRYTAIDLMHLADPLESEAQNELSLFLGYVCRLGFHKLLICPLRPPTPAHTKRPPLAEHNATAE